MNNKQLLIFLIFISAVGICAGAFFEVNMHGSGKEQIMTLVSSFLSAKDSQGFVSCFTASLSKWSKIWLALLLSPVIPFLTLLCPFACMLMGITIGFSSTMLVETFGLKGSLYILATILPQSLIRLPLICFLCFLSIKMALLICRWLICRKKQNNNALREFARHYILTYLSGLIILIISCLIEVFLMQVLP